MTNRDQRIHTILTEKLNPASLVINNQSGGHKHHSGDDGTGETHYDILIVSEDFTGKSKVNRHRMVTDLLKEEFDTGLHALSLTLKTPQEIT